MPRVGQLPWRCIACDQYPAYAVFSDDNVRVTCPCGEWQLMAGETDD